MAKKMQKSNKLIWLIIILTGLALALYGCGGDKAGREASQETAAYEVEKSGAAATADFNKTAYAIHAAVDESLGKAGLKGAEIQAVAKDVPRRSVEGNIRWHFREILVKEGRAAAGWQQQLTALVGRAGGVVLAEQQDVYQGLPVLRLDIGIQDSLGGDPLTMVTDRLFIAVKTAAAAPQPKVRGQGKLALVIDDFGYTREPIAAFVAIGRPLTFAVLPYRTYSNEAAARGISAGQQVILHLPVEPLRAADQSEETTITVDMSDAEIREAVVRAVQAVPGIIGVNNHQGSRGTADLRVMKNILQVLKDNSLFFIDSRTNSQSLAYDTARKMGLRSGENHLFLDNEDNVEAIKRQLRSAGKMALTNGQAIVIGHARMNTATAVREMLPELEASGVELVFASQLLQ